MGKYERKTPIRSYKRTARVIGKLSAVALAAAVVGVVCYELIAPFFTDPGQGVVPNATEESVPEAADTVPDETKALAILNQMTLHEKICQLFIVTQEQLTKSSDAVTESGEAAKAAIEAFPVGGIVYFAQNIVTPDQCTEMIRDIQSYSKLGLFIAVDEEGGLVARIGNNAAMGTTAFPPMASVGQEGTEAAYQAGFTIGREIAAFGFNLDFAPVADVNSNPQNPVIGDRAFSTDAGDAASLVASAVEGFRDGGILCCLKHFPGHGDTASDSHYGAAISEKTLEMLEQVEFLPFASGMEAGAEFVMVGHISTPNVTDDGLPASLSHQMVTEILRQQLGFQGIVVTDSMSMQAITNFYSPSDAAVRAIEAGVDIVLMPADLGSAVQGLEEAVSTGLLTEERINESVLRILKVKLESGILDG